MLNSHNYNPDVLTCLANLSNDEVFTLPKMVNEILDLLPAEIWSDKNATFLDPVCKSGVFLREIAKRLDEGLQIAIPDRSSRINHIFKNQIFGIAITELTSLLSRRSVYCSKTANGKYSVCERFDDPQGNIRFERIEHTWEHERCIFCGARQANYERGEELESHAYQFIHTVNQEEIFNMKFDVIVGNPPYQLSDGGFGTSASPIYHYFVQQAKKLNPRFLIMIIPARWFSGGKGLDGFREEMLKDNRIREIHDFPDASDVFPGVQIKGGVCYFKWVRDDKGLCKVSSYDKGKLISEISRPLLESDAETFIRYNEAVSIVKKVESKNESTIKSQISARKPFGLPTTYQGKKKSFVDCIELYQNGGIGYIEKNELKKNIEIVHKHKVLIPRAGSGSDSFPHSILGNPFVVEPDSACTETYIVAGSYDKKAHAENLATYIATKFFRFLVLLSKSTQDATAKVYRFVPVQDFSKPWTDEELYKKYGLTKDEIAFIESMIRPMEPSNE
jgi:site-specific DNA-methyltransferase (adenine-specific)